MGRTLYDKLWDAHVVADLGDRSALIYVDRHLLHEVSTPQSFEALRESGRSVRRPEANLAVADHSVPTRDRRPPIADPQARAQVARLAQNCADFGIAYIPLEDPRQGIVHVVGPELGFTQPGVTIVCGDSHTSTHGAFGALAFGIGASECGVVMATQCLRQARSKRMLVRIAGSLHPMVESKDLALALIAAIGANGGTGFAIEYAGEAVSAMSMAARMTLCNMSIEAGARVGLVAPDAVTGAFLRDRPMSPKGEMWTRAVESWAALASDDDAVFDRVVDLDASSVAPHVTWGSSPQDAAPITARIPDPAAVADVAQRQRMQKSLDYMGLEAGTALTEVAIDVVFIGSCTNGRLEDLRSAAAVVAGRHVAPRVSAMVAPGSTAVKCAAEAEGLDRIFIEAGFEWRESGCSMCVAMNGDRLAPGQRSASTSNRNFEGRQGPGGRTHLMSPAMAAAAAVAGRLVDVRILARA